MIYHFYFKEIKFKNVVSLFVTFAKKTVVHIRALKQALPEINTKKSTKIKSV